MFSFIETKLFSRLRESYLSDQEYSRVQVALIENPEDGDLVLALAGYESCAGLSLVAESVVAFASSITRRLERESFSC
jgi:hypothetical protein